MAVVTEIMDADAMRRAVKRISHQVLESMEDTDGLIIIGIKRRGISIAGQIVRNIREISGKDVAAGTLDITFYRDDVDVKETEKAVAGTKMDCDVDGKKVVLVDDVLYTGRTVRAAMDALTDSGRPALVKFAALVDRGHRELPVKADFVGKNIPTAPDETIKVKVLEYDGEEGVFLEKG